MFKTLIVLAASMTGTTALLGWIDPSVSPPTSTPTVEDLLPRAREVVAEGLRAHQSEWREIAVSMAESDDGRWLAAGPETGDRHFFIDGRGRLTTTTAWQRQTPTRSGETTIVVHLGAAQVAGKPTDAQLSAARALVLALNELAVPPDRPLVIAAFAR